ncbi:MarR family transcriptional regulator [Rhodococcus kroppenstedtii]|uniref:DNA-binding transcriptional regulator, MarR family n=1 Tax=Rhodococcoides kroppenstedtii TaxID=293050 RepID=A0A1I0SYW2_9NOCA|nr:MULTISPECIES: MarR family transcriptional regulator [Rhodococcus]AMY20946.1 Organic hydroperoxide resistance transcriptional regulator [Rhodococcus sp. PBTS 1]MDV7198466.1 MarR family transcriptional regulator [Rhodococcus kroppenstedtii]SFA44704.1 DNA-binding transcriptional regulator, MarR family [Rhodococcus kroppenstedtii]
MTVTDPLALDRQVCFALAVTNRAVLGVYRPILEPLGLTHPQYLVMLALWERTPQSAGDIARTLCLDPASATPLLKRLEVRGLLTRRRSEDDERRLVVDLTAAGHDLRAEAEKVPARVVEALGVDTADLERLHAALSVVNHHANSVAERIEQ